MTRSDDPTELPDIDFYGVARELEIPEEKLSDPAVREFVGLVARRLQLELDFYHASSRAIQTPPHLTPGPGSASFVSRYTHADNLMRMIGMVLHEGFAQWSRPIATDHFSYLVEKGNKALSEYGLVVRKKPASRAQQARSR